jgi:hypothetical protein
MPILLHTCPTCNSGIKQGRGWQWIDPRPWIVGECTGDALYCALTSGQQLGERVGLLWIGTAFYPTPAAFIREASEHGISRRIKTIPRGFKVGEHWVFLAHPKAITVHDNETGQPVSLPGVFRIFKPTAIEKIVTESMAADADEMAKLEKAGITPVIVPDDDLDHQGTVYDDGEETQADSLLLKKCGATGSQPVAPCSAAPPRGPAQRRRRAD